MEYGKIILSHWDKLVQAVCSIGESKYVIDLTKLDLVDIVFVARYGSEILFDECSMLVLPEGESALHPSESQGLQRWSNAKYQNQFQMRFPTIEQEAQAATDIGLRFMEPNPGKLHTDTRTSCNSLGSFQQATCFSTAFLDNSDELIADTVIAKSWIKAGILCTLSTAAGQGGFWKDLRDGLQRMLEVDMFPLLPISPYCGYIRTSTEPMLIILDIFSKSTPFKVVVGTRTPFNRRIVSANQALDDLHIPKIVCNLGKETAGQIGIPVSSGSAALLLHDASCALVMSQVLMAMFAECQHGLLSWRFEGEAFKWSSEGQLDVAFVLHSLLYGSKLIYSRNDNVRQDSFGFKRVSSQIESISERLHGVHDSIVYEAIPNYSNSDEHRETQILRNVELIQSGTHIIRSTLFEICEMVSNEAICCTNNSRSNAKLIDLGTDEFFGTDAPQRLDVAFRSNLNQLSYLAQSPAQAASFKTRKSNVVSSDQLLLVSNYATCESFKVFFRQFAKVIFTACQMLDHTAIKVRFLAAFRLKVQDVGGELLDAGSSLDGYLVDWFAADFWCCFLHQHERVDTEGRFKWIGNLKSRYQTQQFHEGIWKFAEEYLPALEVQAERLWTDIHERHDFATTIALLGVASSKVYSFVRRQLGIPFLSIHPSRTIEDPVLRGVDFNDRFAIYTDKILRALEDGSMFVPFMECWREAMYGSTAYDDPGCFGGQGPAQENPVLAGLEL